MYASGQQSFHSSSTPWDHFFKLGLKKYKIKRSSKIFEGSWRILFGIGLKKKKGPHFFYNFLNPWDHCFEFGLKKEKKKKVLRHFCGELKNSVQDYKRKRVLTFFYNFLTPQFNFDKWNPVHN